MGWLSDKISIMHNTPGIFLDPAVCPGRRERRYFRWGQGSGERTIYERPACSSSQQGERLTEDRNNTDNTRSARGIYELPYYIYETHNYRLRERQCENGY